MSSIKVKNISKWFGNNLVIKNVSLEIKDGEFVVLVGPSGCGKSTLLRIISGLEDLDEGEILINSEDVTSKIPSERKLSMVFQSYALYPHMNVYENIGFSLKTSGVDKELLKKKIAEVAKILKLDSLLNRLPKQLSGGQRQRVAIGRAIIRQPRAFLFDEPLSNLDASLRVEMRLEISRLHKQLGITTIYVTHDQVEAMTLADRIVILNLGNIEQVGTPDDIYNNPSNIFVAQFIGTPKMNILPLNSESIVSDNKINFLGNEIIFQKTKFEKKNYFLGIRPEHFSVSNDSEFKFKPKVDLVENLGNEKIVYMSNDNLELSAKISSQVDFQSELNFDSKDIFIFDEHGSRI